MHRSTITLSLILLCLALSMPGAWADQTIVYPSQDNPLFSVSAPDDWEFEAAEAEDDYFTLTGPTGAVLYFRSVQADDMEAAIAETEEYIEEQYKNVEMGETTEKQGNGYAVFAANATGVDRESGDAVAFGFGWIALASQIEEKNQIAEIWFEADASDDDGIELAQEIIATTNGRHHSWHLTSCRSKTVVGAVFLWSQAAEMLPGGLPTGHITDGLQIHRNWWVRHKQAFLR